MWQLIHTSIRQHVKIKQASFSESLLVKYVSKLFRSYQPPAKALRG